MPGYLDSLNRVVRERVVGSPPHSFQKLGTLERVNYVQRIGTIKRIGSLGRIGSIGDVAYVNRMGTLGYIGRTGTIQNVGTLNIVNYTRRIGTVPRIGSVRYIGTVNRLGGGYLGTVGRIGTAHVGTVSTIQKGMELTTRSLRYSALAEGSTWVGSWQHVGSFRTKTIHISGRGTPMGGGIGSMAIVAGLHGTERWRTGTYLGLVRIGSPSWFSFTESIRYVRPVVRKSGTYRGTISVSLGLLP